MIFKINDLNLNGLYILLVLFRDDLNFKILKFKGWYVDFF